jgi:hypothetical protein
MGEKNEDFENNDYYMTSGEVKEVKQLVEKGGMADSR